VWRVLACRASPSSWPDNNLSINTFSIVSQTHVITRLNFNPMCLAVPKAVRMAFGSNFLDFHQNQWQHQVLGGVVLEWVAGL